MGERTRSLYGADQRKELWERWSRGDTISEIARALDRKPGTIHSTLSRSGGIAPVPKKRPGWALRKEEREEISRGISRGESIRGIARRLGRSASTVSREIKRNGGGTKYRAVNAEKQAEKRRHRPKECLLKKNRKLCRLVAKKLKQKWSPEQIAGWLKREYEDHSEMRVSHETIYKTLFIQARGALRKELKRHLRTKRGMRRSRHSTTSGQTRGQIIGAVSIRERPAEAEDRAVPGHWEGDLLSGSGSTHIATLVERSSRFTMLVQLEGKDSETVVGALGKKIRKLPRELKRSLTWDRGSELARHADFTLATKVDVFFCDPQSPWQRGSNENTNGLLRQYFPKGTSLAGISQNELDRVAAELNERPRKTLGFRTPTEVLNMKLLH